MTNKVIFDFGEIDLFEDFAVGRINDGVIVDRQKVLDMFQYSLSVYDEKPFGYISDRINSYSLKPEAYEASYKAKNLVAMAVVVNTPAKRMSAAIEKMFSKIPFRQFKTLPEAKTWIKEQLASHLKSVHSA